MAYASSPEVLRERIAADPALQLLEQGQSAAWNVEPGTAEKFAYRLRETLAMAKRFKKDFPALAAAAEKFSIVIIGERTESSRIEAKLRQTARSLGSAPIHGIGDGLNVASASATVGLTTAMHVVDAWRRHQPSNDAIQCTQTFLPEDELIQLYRWAKTQTPRLMFFIVEGGVLTLAVAEEDVETYAWHPQAASKPEETFDL